MSATGSKVSPADASTMVAFSAIAGVVFGIIAMLGVLALTLVCLVVAPMLMIWAVNTLFALAIPYTPWTIAAVLILLGLMRARAPRIKLASKPPAVAVAR